MASTPEPPFDEAYFNALGQFVHYFAAVERLIARLLQYFARIKPAEAIALFSGNRLDTSIGLIKRILETRGLSTHRARMEEPFAQLGVINGIRNQILHYGINIQPDQTLGVWKRGHVQTLDQYRAVDTDALVAMTHDLFRIYWMLMLERHPTDLPDEHRQHAEKLKREPWRYKPPQPVDLQKKSRRQSRRRAGRRASSRE